MTNNAALPPASCGSYVQPTPCRDPPQNTPAISKNQPVIVINCNKGPESGSLFYEMAFFYNKAARTCGSFLL